MEIKGGGSTGHSNVKQAEDDNAGVEQVQGIREVALDAEPCAANTTGGTMGSLWVRLQWCWALQGCVPVTSNLHRHLDCKQ